MRSTMWSAAANAFVLVSVTAAQDKAQPSKTRGGDDVITVLGCVQKEADYRTQKSDGKGGVANTGAGVANEFVLRSAHSVDKNTLKPIDSGEARGETVYSLTGSHEGEVASAVGQKVAATGYVERAKSEGTDKVKDLPDFNIQSWKKVQGGCS